MGISVQPEFIKIFKKSNYISTVYGKSHFLARMPKSTKDKLRIKGLEEERKKFNERDKDIENQFAELNDKLKK